MSDATLAPDADMILISRAEYDELQARVCDLSTPTTFWRDDRPEEGCCDWRDEVMAADVDAVTKFMTSHDLAPHWGAAEVLGVDSEGHPDQTAERLFLTEAEARDCYPRSLQRALDDAGLTHG